MPQKRPGDHKAWSLREAVVGVIEELFAELRVALGVFEVWGPCAFKARKRGPFHICISRI